MHPGDQGGAIRNFWLVAGVRSPASQRKCPPDWDWAALQTRWVEISKAIDLISGAVVAKHVRVTPPSDQ
jgi:hypothetical protein